MSEEMEDGKFEALEPAPLRPRPTVRERSGSTMRERPRPTVGQRPRSTKGARPHSTKCGTTSLRLSRNWVSGRATRKNSGSPAAGCYLSSVRMDRHGHGGVVVGWLFRDSVVPGEKRLWLRRVGGHSQRSTRTAVVDPGVPDRALRG